MEERVQRLEQTTYHAPAQNDRLANTVFKNIEETQKQLTTKLFETVPYKGETKIASFDSFQEEYKKELVANTFSSLYNGYYDNKNPSHLELKIAEPINTDATLRDLFSEEKVELVYTSIALQHDLATLNHISNNPTTIKTFDYDGVRYKKKQAAELAERLTAELERLTDLVKSNDVAIYTYFRKLEAGQNKPQELETLYADFLAFDATFDATYDVYNQLGKGLEFVAVTTPFEQIRTNLNSIKPLEETLKREIAQMFTEDIYQPEITPEIRENFERYSAKELTYFNGTSYNEDNLSVLYAAMNNFAYLMSRRYFLMKKKVLLYQEQLVQE